METLVFLISLAAYFTLHSLLAAEGVKSFLIKKWVSARLYRLLYNLLAVFLLLPLAWLFFTVKQERMLGNEWFAVPGGILMAGGLIWIYRAMQGYDVREFTGLLQLKNGSQPEHTMLNVSGLNKIVRHPLYLGTLLLVWGLFLLMSTPVALGFAAVSTVYLYVGSKLEERKLTQQFGEAYRSYQQNVPMLLPYKFKRAKN